MKVRTVARTLPGCLVAVLTLIAAAQTVVPQSSEQIETGYLTGQDGHQIAYRIRLLPLASFPAVPQGIRTELEARSCMVPQTYEAHAPENVLHGAFERQGANDWAVLCSTNGSTSLLVFFADRQNAPFTLASGKNSQWIAVAPTGQVLGFAWGIDAVGPAEMALDTHAAPETFDHDGVRGEFIAASPTLHYFQKGEWTSFSPSD